MPVGLTEGLWVIELTSAVFWAVQNKSKTNQRKPLDSLSLFLPRSLCNHS